MSEDEKRTGENSGAHRTQARFVLLAMLLLFAGTVALLLYAYFKHGAPTP